MRKNLIKLRRRSKLTQKELADYLNISERQYSRLESSESDGSIKIWQKLKTILNASSIDYLLEVDI